MKSFLVIVTLVLTGCAASPREDRVCFDRNCYKVEIVQDSESRTKGLMFRESMPPDRGMLFVFPRSAVYPFWMKNTLLPLDMIWMDYSRRIVHIESDVPPCKEDPCPQYSPHDKALYVLELNAGEAAKLGLKSGQFAEFRLADE